MSASRLPAISDYWDQRSEGFSQQVAREVSEGREDFYASIFSEAPVGRALDIGCGPGLFSVLLAKLGWDVTAVDCSEGMLEKAAAYAKSENQEITFLKDDAQKLATFGDNSFDLIVSRNVVWNLEAPLEAYRRWLSLLKPGGRLIVFDGNHYRHLFDVSYLETMQASREKHILLDVKTEVIDEIAKGLPLGRVDRPQWDIDTLSALGADVVRAEVLTSKPGPAGDPLVGDFVVIAKKS